MEVGVKSGGTGGLVSKVAAQPHGISRAVGGSAPFSYGHCVEQGCGCPRWKRMVVRLV